MDVFAEHGIAGIVGLLFNALFGTDAIVGLDGVNTSSASPARVGGWLIHNWKQLYIQIAYIVATAAYAFVVSAIIAFAINAVPGLRLRASEEAELLGMDDDQLGEFAYDYVEVRRDYLAWTPQKHDQLADGHEIPAAERYGIGPHSEMMLEGRVPVGADYSQPVSEGDSGIQEVKFTPTPPHPVPAAGPPQVPVRRDLHPYPLASDGAEDVHGDDIELREGYGYTSTTTDPEPSHSHFSSTTRSQNDDGRVEVDPVPVRDRTET